MASRGATHHHRTPTLADKRARAINLLSFCTPERFAVLTADDIATHSGIKLAEAEKMLAAARSGRGM